MYSKTFSEENQDEKVACELLKLLSSDRANAYETWIQTGWVLFNISDNLLDAFKNFSRRVDKYDERACDKVWDACKRGPNKNDLTIASLHFWVKLDGHENRY